MTEMKSPAVHLEVLAHAYRSRQLREKLCEPDPVVVMRCFYWARAPTREAVPKGVELRVRAHGHCCVVAAGTAQSPWPSTQARTIQNHRDQSENPDARRHVPGRWHHICVVCAVQRLNRLSN